MALSVGYSAFGLPEEPEREPLPHDIAAEPVMGWRAWRVNTPSGQIALDANTVKRMAAEHDAGCNPFRRLLLPSLGGVNDRQPWDDTTVKAECRPSSPMSLLLYGDKAGTHDAPHDKCKCGYWAVKDEAVLAEVLASYHRQGGLFAFGRVQMWGRVIEHTKGYRSEYARPYDVVIVGGDDAIAAGLRDRYAIDVRLGEMPALAVEIAAARAQDKSSSFLTFSQQMYGTGVTSASAVTSSALSFPIPYAAFDFGLSAKRKRHWWPR